MEVSAATSADIPALCQLLGELFAQEAEFHPEPSRQAAGLRQIIEDPQVGRILVLRDGDAVIGMVNLLFTVSTALGGRVALLEDMVIAESQRDRGAGRRLLRAAVEVAKATGCLRITLLTDATNRAAQRFYTREGFTVSDMRPLRLLL